MDNRHLFSRRKYSNKTNPKERVEAHGFGLTSGRSPRRASASISNPKHPLKAPPTPAPTSSYLYPTQPFLRDLG